MRSLPLKMKNKYEHLIFEHIFEFTQIRQVYKGKVGRGNFQNAAIWRLVHQFDSIFFKVENLQSRKIQEISHYGCY